MPGASDCLATFRRSHLVIALLVHPCLWLALGQAEPRPPHPFAPSLPALTDEQENHLDGVIDRFMQFDTGRLPGAAGSRALDDFLKLDAEAMPALLRGLRKAADLEHSCPVLVIAKRIRTLLMRSTDRQVLDFARDEIAAIDSRRYRGLLTELRVQVSARQAGLDRNGVPDRAAEKANSGPLARLTVDELNRRVRQVRDEKVLTTLGRELARREEPAAALGLGLLASSVYPEVRQAGSKALTEWLAGRKGPELRTLLGHEIAPVRQGAAVRLLASRDSQALDALVLLKDAVASVRRGVHAELVRQAGKDLADPGDQATSQEEALAQWLDWWSAQPEK